MSSIEWTEPPETSGRIFTREVKSALQSRPGQWACIKRSHPSAATVYTFVQRNPEYEVRTTSNGDGTYDLYARFVGEQS